MWHFNVGGVEVCLWVTQNVVVSHSNTLNKIHSGCFLLTDQGLGLIMIILADSDSSIQAVRDNVMLLASRITL